MTCRSHAQLLNICVWSKFRDYKLNIFGNLQFESSEMANIFLLSLVLLIMCGVWETNGGFFLDDDGDGGHNAMRDFQSSPFDAFSHDSNDFSHQVSFGGIDSPLSNNIKPDFRSGHLAGAGGGRRGGTGKSGGEGRSSGGTREPPMKRKWREKKEREERLRNMPSTKQPQRIVIQTTKKGYITEYPYREAEKETGSRHRKPKADPMDDFS